MTFGLAVAICDNMGIPGERAKFSDEQILEAIRVIVDHKDQMKFITKPALWNACDYLVRRLNKNG